MIVRKKQEKGWRRRKKVNRFRIIIQQMGFLSCLKNMEHPRRVGEMESENLGSRGLAPGSR